MDRKTESLLYEIQKDLWNDVFLLSPHHIMPGREDEAHPLWERARDKADAMESLISVLYTLGDFQLEPAFVSLEEHFSKLCMLYRLNYGQAQDLLNRCKVTLLEARRPGAKDDDLFEEAANMSFFIKR